MPRFYSMLVAVLLTSTTSAKTIPADATRLILTTTEGDIVIALNGTASKHEARLLSNVRKNGYTTVPVNDVSTGLYLRIGGPKERLSTNENSNIEALPAELSSPTILDLGSVYQCKDHHSIGSIYISLTNQELPSECTVIGMVESGADTINRIVAREPGSAPQRPTMVQGGSIRTRMDQYYAENQRSPRSDIITPDRPSPGRARPSKKTHDRLLLLFLLLPAISALSCLLVGGGQKRIHLIITATLSALVTIVGIATLGLPLAKESPIFGVGVVIFTLAVTKFISMITVAEK